VDQVIEELVQSEPVDIGVDWTGWFRKLGYFAILKLKHNIPNFAQN